MQTLNHSLQVLSVISSHALCNVLKSGSPLEPLCTDSLLQKRSALTPHPAVQTFPGRPDLPRWCHLFTEPVSHQPMETSPIHTA